VAGACYVMPLRQYETGDVVSPAARLMTELTGRRAKTLSILTGGFIRRGDPDAVDDAARREADETVARIRRAVAEANPGTDVDWPDQGGTAYTNSVPDDLALCAFTLWLDHRETVPRFVAPPAPRRPPRVAPGTPIVPGPDEWSRHPIRSGVERTATRCPHLVGNSYTTGRFLPVDFDHPVVLMDEADAGRPIWMRVRTTVGSVPRLRRELRWVAPFLGIDDAHADRVEPGVPPVTWARPGEPGPAGPPDAAEIAAVRAAIDPDVEVERDIIPIWKTYEEAARIAAARRLPIIIEG